MSERIACPTCGWRGDYEVESAPTLQGCPTCGGLLRANPAGSTEQTRSLGATEVSTGERARAPGTVAAGGVFGPYQVLGEIARGGMGAVFLARHATIGRTVALKVLLAGVGAGETDNARFLLECRVLARLRHPNIVTLYDAGVHEGRRFLAMEYVKGPTLAKEFNSGRLDLAARLRMLARVCRAVHHAHLHGIIHRDLKPSNVLVGEDSVPRVADFGLAKVLRATDTAVPGSGEAEMTASGHVLGTPAYMSPEQALGESRDLDLRTDVYSLGVMAYQAVSGRLPFEGSHPLATIGKVIASLPAPLGPGVPRDLAIVIGKAMEKDRESRYQSAVALAEDIESYLEGRPIAARGASISYRAAKWIRRHRRASAVVAALLASLVAIWTYLARLPGTLVLDAGDDVADVYVDGALAGRTEPGRALSLELPPGPHELRVENEKSFPVEQSLTLSPSETREIGVRLRKRAGFLAVATDPAGASVEVAGPDARAIASTPEIVELDAGTYEVTIRLPGYRPALRAVEIRSGGELTRLVLPLEPLGSGRLRVQSQLDGVALDIFAAGTTAAEPLARHIVPFPSASPAALPAGDYLLRFSKPGYIADTREVRIEEGRTADLWVQLAPIEVWSFDLGVPLHGAIFVADADRSGDYDILVLTRDGGPVCLERESGRTGWRVRWRRTEGQAYVGGVLGSADALVDLDGNGALDLLYLASDGRRYFLIAASGQDGEFLWAQDVGLEVRSSPIGADLDGDGRPEVLQGDSAGALHVFEGASGRERLAIPLGSGPAGTPAVCDLDGDGLPEVVASNGAGVLQVLDPRTGRSLFRHSPGDLSATTLICSADFTGDGRPEIVFLTAEGTVHVRGAFEDGDLWSVRFDSGVTRGILLADLGPADGTLDVVVASSEGKIHALDGRTGDPLWKAVSLEGPLHWSHGPALTDWDSDGVPDIAAVTSAGRVAVVSGSNGRILWSHELHMQTAGNPALADLDGDGLPEVFVAGVNGRVAGVAPRLGVAWWRDVEKRTIDQVLVETPGDREPDAVLLDDYGGLERIESRTGRSVFRVQTQTGFQPFLSHVGHDLDGDGTQDVWLGGTGVVEARSGGDGSRLWGREFEAVRRLSAWPADLDGDGVPDPVAVLEVSGGVPRNLALALRGQGGEDLWPSPADLGPAGDWNIWQHEVVPVVGDLDGDGRPDVLVAQPGGTLTALSGRDGHRLWRREGIAPTVLDPHLVCSPAIADLDGDGEPDVLQPSGVELLAFRGRDGEPLATPLPRLPYWNRWAPVPVETAAGAVHLLVGSENAVTAYLLPGLAPLWERRLPDASQPVPQGPAVADWTGDGVPDVLFATLDGSAELLDGADGSVIGRARAGEAIVARPLATVSGLDGVPLALLASSHPRLSAHRIAPPRGPTHWPSIRPGTTCCGDHRLIVREMEKEEALVRLLDTLSSEAPSSSEASAALLAYRRQAGEDAWYYYGLGFERAIDLDRDGALQALSASLAHAPSLVRPRLLRARLWIEAGRCEEAVADLDTVLVPGSRTWRASQLRGIAELALGRPERAIRDLSEAAAGSDDADLYFRRAQAYFQLREFTRAQEDLDRVLSRWPGWAEPLWLRARAREELGHDREALSDYETYLARGTNPELLEDARDRAGRLREKLGG
ncbi:MAG: VCBS repeat-containing protein [Planctomycetes bacterium]|nr:VCBS repeat-containing protein [Planctomycetota bacterium]